MDLSTKTAIVTGTSSGIGAAIATAFLEAGATVLGVDRSDASIEHAAYSHRALDLTADNAATVILSDCENRFGPPDILVNNAGIGAARSILETSDADFERYLAVNLKAPFALCREVIRSMQGRGGAIVNIASVFGMIGAAESAAYVPTKAGIIGLTRCLATEFGRDGIRVNAVAPGTIETPLTADRIAKDTWFGRMNFDTTPAGRLGKPTEIADAVLFLASDHASFITGVTLPVDGGWSMAKFAPHPRVPQ